MRVPTDLTQEQLLGVTIEESGEKLVNIKKECPKIFIYRSLFENCGSLQYTQGKLKTHHPRSHLQKYRLKPLIHL